MRVSAYLTQFLLVSLLFFTGCGKSFIDIVPVSDQTTVTFFKTESDFRQGVNAIYDGLQSAQTYGKAYYYLMEIRSDNTDVADRNANAGVASQLDLFTEITTNSLIYDAYAGSYTIINRANVVLDRINEAPISEALKNQFKGESLFLRGLTYFNLVRLFGKIPLVLKTETTSEARLRKRDAVADIYAQIEADLKEAAALLPQTYTDNTDIGRATAGAATAILGKVYVTEKKWNDAIDVLTPLIGKYTLLNNYSDLFSPTQPLNNETLFCVRYQKGLNPSEGNSYFSDIIPFSFYFNGIIYGGSNNNRPTQDLIHSYERTDKRLPASLDTVYKTNATTTAKGAYVKKFIDAPSTTNDGGSSFPIIRYAEILLLLAEAQNEINYNASTSNTSAFGLLNTVRVRAGLNEKTSVDAPSQNAFRELIFKERRVELAFENDRWFDLIRKTNGTTILQQYLQNEYHLTTPVLNQDRLLFPIPQREIDIHADPVNFSQNPGY